MSLVCPPRWIVSHGRPGAYQRSPLIRDKKRALALAEELRGEAKRGEQVIVEVHDDYGRRVILRLVRGALRPPDGLSLLSPEGRRRVLESRKRSEAR